MIKLKRFNKSNPNVESYAFLMIYLNDPDGVMKSIQDKISRDDIYEPDSEDYGIEDETHVTIVPCMDDDVDKELVRDYCSNLDNYHITGSHLDKFECDDYDVLIVPLESRELVATNAAITRVVETHSKYTEYRPHATVAYMKKGCADKYLNLLDKEIEFTPEEFVISYHEGSDEMKYYKWK